MGEPLGSSRVNSHKQNREGVIQNGQYRATTESRLGCDIMVSEPGYCVVRVCRRGRQAPKGGGL